ncbi:hypothetical protein, partial [Candidatus Nitrosocosmicus sp. SS]
MEENTNTSKCLDLRYGLNNRFKDITTDSRFLPIEVYNNNVDTLLSRNSNFNKVLAIVIGTKPDFYKQAPV